MTAFLITLNQLAILAILSIIGYYMKKKNHLTDDGVKSLSFILLTVCVPSIVITAMQIEYSRERLYMGLLTIACNISFMFLGYALAFLVTFFIKMDEKEKKVWLAGAMLSNSIFIGLPVTVAIIGDEATFYLCFLSVSFNLIAYTFVIRIFAGKAEGTGIKEGIIKVLKTPAIIAVFIGFILFISGLRLPSFINTPFEYFAKTTTPISMIVLGALVSKSTLRELFSSKNIYFSAAIRLFIMPLLAIFIFGFIIKNDIARYTVILAMAMPIATTVPVFAEQYGECGDIGARYCVMSTILSLISLPIITFILSFF